MKQLKVALIAASLLSTVGFASSASANNYLYGEYSTSASYFMQMRPMMMKMSAADKKKAMDMEMAIMKMEGDHAMAMAKAKMDHTMAIMKMKREYEEYLFSKGAF